MSINYLRRPRSWRRHFHILLGAIKKPTLYGGQAVYEGVMMRGRTSWAITCRAATGQLVSRTEKLTSSIYTSGWARLPLIRGVALLWETLNLGLRAMNFAANVALAGEEGRDAGKEEVPQAGLGASAFIGLGLGLALFFALPVVATNWIDQWLGTNVLASNLIEGAIRLALLIGYIFAIGQIGEIKRVFGYHGAEHKTINAFEAGAPLTVPSVQRFSLAHPRCGTGFLLFVAVIATLVFVLLGKPPVWLRLLSRLALIPVIAAITYEFIRFGAAHYANPVIRVLMTPSIWLQGLTTRQPEDGMVEAAILSFKHVLYTDTPDHPALDGFKPEQPESEAEEVPSLV